MIKIKMPAFSLAEAMITLLIVCLITLASIPVLTKKKRSTTEGAHGTWMCAYKTDGTLAHWSTSDPQGDTKDPDTWKEGCNFVPPVNVSTYNITAIGAGGSGGDGQSKLVEVANGASEGAFVPTETGLYRVMVVGGGGGGGRGRHRDKFNGWCHSGTCGSGGAGASGAYVIADVTLHAGTTYTLTKGGGGKEGGTCAHGTCSRPSYTRAPSGGDSKFFSAADNGKAINIYAKGGQGGQRVTTGGSGCCEDNCGGGGGGQRPNSGAYYIKINNTDKTNTAIAGGNGNSGNTGGCARIVQASGGSGFNASKFGINKDGLGTGGHGGSVNLWADGCPFAAGAGTDGAVIVYKIVRMQGYGGKAAKPEEKMSMSVKGKINIQVGRTYSKDAQAVQTNGVFDLEKYRNLRTTKVELYDKLGRLTKKIVSYPGDDGTTFEGNKPLAGEFSYWTEDGGGAAAVNKCDQDGQTPVYDGAEEAREEPVCKEVKCKINAEEAMGGYQKGDNPNANKTVVPIVDTIKYNTLSRTGIENYLAKISKSYFEQFFKDSSTGLVDYQAIYDGRESYFKSVDDDLQTYYNYDRTVSSYPMLKNNNEVCFVDDVNKLKYSKKCNDAIDPTSGKGNTVVVQPVGAKIIGYKTNYKCYDGGNATKRAFGAGGGGGYAYEVPGFASKGGFGASGAVIIEW